MTNVQPRTAVLFLVLIYICAPDKERETENVLQGVLQVHVNRDALLPRTIIPDYLLVTAESTADTLN